MKKKLGLPFVSLLICILLNSILLASPTKPAIIRNAVVERTQLVVPFTRWQRFTRYYAGETLTVFASIDDDNLWAVRIVYSTKRVGLDFIDEDVWVGWITARLSTYLNNIYLELKPEMPVEADRDEQIRLYVEYVDDPAVLAQLGAALRTQFNVYHKGILILQGVKLEVEQITLAEYQASRD